MKRKLILALTLVLGGGLVNISFAAAGKCISSKESDQARLDWNLKMLAGAYQTAGQTNSTWDEPAKRALAESAGAKSF